MAWVGAVSISVGLALTAGVVSPFLLSGDAGSCAARLTVPVISPKGNVGGCGSGDFEGAGVGRGGIAGSAEVFRGPRSGTALLRRGDARLEGEVGSTVGAILTSGSKI